MYVLEYGFGPDSDGDFLASGCREGERKQLAYEDWYRRKFRHWRGRSGQSYVFSVYSPSDCPSYEDAVLIVAERGRTRPLACLDVGRFPEAGLAELRKRFGARRDEVEFQIHVLTDRDGDRRSLIEDISGAWLDA